MIAMDEICADTGLTTAPDAGIVAVRRRKRTSPRPEEIALLRSCSSGPRALRDGPVGRCTKHGWLRPVIEPTTSKHSSRVTVRYELTETGRAAIDAVTGRL